MDTRLAVQFYLSPGHTWIHAIYKYHLETHMYREHFQLKIAYTFPSDSIYRNSCCILYDRQLSGSFYYSFLLALTSFSLL